MTKQHPAPGTARPIRTEFFNYKSELIKTNRAKFARSAVLRAVDHMQMDDYNARFVQVYRDGETHPLLLMHRTPKTIRILYKRELV